MLKYRNITTKSKKMKSHKFYSSTVTRYFLPHVAMLARYVVRCLSVSVCHKSEFYRNVRTNRAGFSMGATFDLSYTVLKGISGTAKK